MADDSKRYVKDILALCRQHGWVVRHSKHWVVYPPTPKSRPVFIGCTPSDHRAIYNIRARLRRAGAEFV